MKSFILIVFTIISLSANSAEFYHKCSAEDTNEITQLACNIYFESRGESSTGQRAVAFNTLNRVDSYKYPNTVREVVWQSHQYSWTNDGKSDKIKDYKSYIKALQIATEVYTLAKEDFKISSPVADSLWYHSKSVSPVWRNEKCKVVDVDNHVYYNCVKYR